MNRPARVARLAATIVLSLGAAAAQGQDHEHHHHEASPAGTGLCASQGLAAIGAVVSAGSLELSLGGTLDAASEALVKDPASVAKLLEAVGYGAVNLAPHDLPLGATAIRAFAKGCKVPILSANLHVAGTKERLVAASAIVSALGQRLALVGVTAAPTEAPKDVTVADPAESLSEVLPALEKGSDAIVLLAWLDRPAAAALMRKFPSIKVCIVPSETVADPEPIKIGGAYLVQAPPGVRAVARTTISFGPKGAIQSLDHAFQVADAAPRADVKALVDACGLGDPWVRVADGASSEIAPRASRPEVIPTKLETAKTTALRVHRGNRAVSIDVASCELRADYGTVTAPAGRQFLVIDTTWKNRIPLSLVYQTKISKTYSVPALADRLYLVVNGRRLSGLRDDTSQQGGHIANGFDLERPGSKLRGNVVFDVPAEGLETLDLHYYDPVHGNVVLPILARAKDAAASPAEKVLATLANEVAKVTVVSVKKLAQLGSDTAPPGMTYVAVEVRGQSAVTSPADARISDPNAATDATIRLGNVLTYRDSRHQVHLVLDGENAYAPLAASKLPEEPRFLPDAATGGELLFLVPEKATSIELRCDFQPVDTADGQVVPAPSSAVLEGKRPDPLPQHKSLLTIQDDPFSIVVFGKELADEVAGTKANDGEKFLVLSVLVSTSAAESGSMFSTSALRIQPSGDPIGQDDEVTAKGLRPPTADGVFVPRGERRAFQLVYRISATEKKPRLAFTGVTKSETYDLP
jgi:hypothetical protein